jgi:hypothetical protein
MTKSLHAIWRNQSFLKQIPNFHLAEFYFWSFDLQNILGPGNLFAEVIFGFGQTQVPNPQPPPPAYVWPALPASVTLNLPHIAAISAGFYAPTGMGDVTPASHINPEFWLAELDKNSSSVQVTVTNGQPAINNMNLRLNQTPQPPSGSQVFDIILGANGNQGTFNSNAASVSTAGTWKQKSPMMQFKFQSPFVTALLFPQPVRGEFAF